VILNIKNIFRVLSNHISCYAVSHAPSSAPPHTEPRLLFIRSAFRSFDTLPAFILFFHHFIERQNHVLCFYSKIRVSSNFDDSAPASRHMTSGR